MGWNLAAGEKLSTFMGRVWSQNETCLNRSIDNTIWDENVGDGGGVVTSVNHFALVNPDPPQ